MANGKPELAGLLDDSALWVNLPSLQPKLSSFRAGFPSFVRFLPTSTVARDFGLPPGSAGEVQDRWMRGAVELRCVSTTSDT